MTSPDPEIDGGLPWIRGVDPAAGTRPGSRQDPAQEPTPKPPGSRGGSDPATNWNRHHGRETRLGTDFTEEKPGSLPKMLCRKVYNASTPSLLTTKTLLVSPWETFLCP